MGRRQCKSAYNIIKNKTTPESSPPPTPKSDYCNADKAEENDLKKSLMKMLEEAFEEKMKNVSKEIGENTNKKLEEINKEIEEKKSKKLEEMNNEIEEKKNKKLEEMNNEIEEKKNKRVEEMNKEIEEKRNKKLQELDKEIEEKINKKLKEMNKEIEEKTNKKLEEINKVIEEKTNKKLDEINKEIEDKTNKKLEKINKEIDGKKTKELEEMKKEIEEKDPGDTVADEMERVLEAKEIEDTKRWVYVGPMGLKDGAKKKLDSFQEESSLGSCCSIILDEIMVSLVEEDPKLILKFVFILRNSELIVFTNLLDSVNGTPISSIHSSISNYLKL
ncbi:hypothetical protein STEG23_016850, partial [Scotinomys teguina]